MHPGKTQTNDILTPTTHTHTHQRDIQGKKKQTIVVYMLNLLDYLKVLKKNKTRPCRLKISTRFHSSSYILHYILSRFTISYLTMHEMFIDESWSTAQINFHGAHAASKNIALRRFGFMIITIEPACIAIHRMFWKCVSTWSSHRFQNIRWSSMLRIYSISKLSITQF